MCIRDRAGAIKSLVNVKGLSLECARVLHEGMLLPVLFYGSETMVWNKKYRSKVQCVQMDNLRSMLGVKRINKMRNELIRELCGVKKGVNERIKESMLRWFGNVERMNDSRLVKRMYSGAVSYTHLRAHETPEHLVCRLLLEKKKKKNNLDFR